MTFSEWRKQCDRAAKRLLGIYDLLSDSDPHEIQDAMAAAYADDLTPMEFLQEEFEEELADDADIDFEDDEDYEDDEDFEDDEDYEYD